MYGIALVTCSFISVCYTETYYLVLREKEHSWSVVPQSDVLGTVAQGIWNARLRWDGTSTLARYGLSVC